MAVIKVDLIDWSGSESIRTIEYDLSYLVKTDNRYDGPLIVRQGLLANEGILFGSQYASGNESDTGAKITYISEKRLSSGDFKHWVVDLKYSYSEDEAITPLNEPIKLSVSWEAVQRLTHRWADGSFIVNTAGDPPDQGTEFEDNTPTMTYSLNQAVFPFTLAQAVRNSMNSTTWKGFAPFTVKILSMQADRMFDKRIGVYFNASYSFGINPDTYKSYFASMGFNELRETFPGSGVIKKVPILVGGLGVGVAATQVKTMLPLNINGEVALTPFFVVNSLYPQVDFNTLFPFL